MTYIEKGLPLYQQELLYAELEGKHGALDDEKDDGRFFLNMTQRMKHNHKALIKFIETFNENLA